MAPVKLSPEEIQDIIEDIHCKLYVDDLEEAKRISNDLLEKCPNSAPALEAKAYVLHELNEDEEAIKLLSESIAREPFSNFEKYFLRGQLLSGDEAMSDYEKAIQILKVEISKEKTAKDLNGESIEMTNGKTEEDNDDDWEDVKEEKNYERLLSKVYCQIACELFTKNSSANETFLPDTKLVDVLENAKKSDATYPETYGLMSQYHFMLGNKTQAKEVLEDSRQAWDPLPNTSNYDDIEINIQKQICEALISSDMFSDARTYIEKLFEEELFYQNFMSAKLLFHRGNADEMEKAKEHIIVALTLTEEEDSGVDLEEVVDVLRDINEVLGKSELDGFDEAYQEGDEDEDESDDDEAGARLENELLSRAAEEEMDDD